VNGRGRVMIFWDYDTQWGADRSRSGKKSWGMAEFVNTDRILDLLAARGLKTVFACVGAAAQPGARPYHDPAQIRRMHAEGHEVGSHSLQHDWLPGLGPARLKETLLESRESLEQCIGHRVTTFVPPWNQPYDYLRVGSVSLAERREVRGAQRTDVRRLCAALAETGYTFARLAFRNGLRRVVEAISRREHPRRATVSSLLGVRYVLLNTPAGFDRPAAEMVRRVADDGGIAVVWAHPHSLTADNSQNEKYLVPLLDDLVALRSANRIDVVLPRDLAHE